MTDNWHKCNVLLHVRQCFHLAAVKHHQTLRLSAAGGRQTHFRGDKHGFLLLPEMILTENEVGEVLRQSCRLRHLDLEINPQKTFMSYTQLQLRSIEICDLCWQNESEWAHFQQLLLLFSFSIKITSNYIWLVGIGQKMVELQPFEGERVSRSDIEKNRVKVFWRWQSIIKQRCIFSSSSFLNNSSYIINHNIAIYFILS